MANKTDVVSRVQRKLAKHRIIKNGIDAFWFNQVPNAGDLVTPFLLKKFGFTPILTAPEESKLICCGSLLQRLDPSYKNYILGSGFLTEGPALELLSAKILAIRGKFSRDRVGAPKETVLGDPGLLLANYLPHRERKKYLLGIVPHYSEKEDPWLVSFIQKNEKHAILVDIKKDPMNVLQKMDQCEYILASSLHGIVFADSLKMPRLWISLSSFKPSKLYKFNDYFSAFMDEYQHPYSLAPGTEIEHVLEQSFTPEENKVNEIMSDLEKAFKVLVDNELAAKI